MATPICTESALNTFSSSPSPPPKVEDRGQSTENLKSSIELVVRDNGAGLPEDFDFQKGKSLGLTIVANLSKQISGEVEWNREEGTEFKIKFPLRRLMEETRSCE